MTDIRASRMLPPDVEPVHVHVHEGRAGFALGILVGAALACLILGILTQGWP